MDYELMMDIEKIISTASLKAAVAIVLTRGVETRVRMAELAANLKSCISDKWDEIIDDCAGMSNIADEKHLHAYLSMKSVAIASAAVDQTTGGQR